MKEIQSLLYKVKSISERYELIERYEKNKFNIFEILGLESYEVRTHSKFISDLLRKDGSHQMGAIFFQLFLKCIFPDCVFDSDNYFVTAEEYTNDGYIDIFIKENKT